MMNKKKSPAVAEYKPPDAGRENTYSYDAEYIEFTDYCQKAYKKTKEMLIAADCRTAARRLRKYLNQFNTGPLAMRQIGVDWIGVMDSLLELYCRDAILNQIKNTRASDRGKWTKELLDQKIEACHLDDTERNEIYEAAGIVWSECSYKITQFTPQDTEVELLSKPVSKMVVSS
ncbi:MAG: hypothetical protein LUE24_11470 [Lachnospiraceae bacterium]|nr:hypothetical protein [Lachnospiraceae bacterium]